MDKPADSRTGAVCDVASVLERTGSDLDEPLHFSLFRHEISMIGSDNATQIAIALCGLAGPPPSNSLPQLTGFPLLLLNSRFYP